MCCVAILLKTVFYCTFWRQKILILWRKIVENLLIFVHLFCPVNGPIDFTKTFITQEWLIVESCPTPHWIAFLMLYRLVYNIRSHFNELILAWSAYFNIWCSIKCHTYLKKLSAGIYRFRYAWPFGGHQALKG